MEELEESHKIVMVVLSILGSVILLLLSVFLCSWVWRKVRWMDGDSDEEEVLRKDHATAQFSADSGASTPVRRGSPDGEGSSLNSFGPRAGYNSHGSRKGISLERARREMSTEQSPGTSTPTTPTLTRQFSKESSGTCRDLRTTALQKSFGSAPGTPTGSEGGSRRPFSRTGSTTSMWQNVKDIAAKLIEDPQVMEDQATDSIVDGLDYKLGKIQVGLVYDFQSLTLTLRVIRAEDLPAKDLTGASDPYVRILMLPDKKHKLMTKVKKRNLNPHWNECFIFEGWPHNKLLDKCIYLQVIDYDRFSKDDPIGETYVPLNEIDLSQGPVMWKYLQPCKETRGKLGELLLSLCYQPSIGRLTVIVMKAKDLKAKDITGSSDPYVKLWLSYGNTRVEKKKTAIKMSSLNPVFNESFIFNVPWDRLREASMEVTVMDFDRVGRNELIGKVNLSCRSGPMETRHWNDMAAKPRQQVAQWHLLKE
ncbi:hypothetical protein ACOMHN_049638 [Nucella lapillus]